MESKDRCPNCGAMVLPTEHFCPQCGAQLQAVDQQGTVQSAPSEEFHAYGAADATGEPRTIEALKAFCAANGMPLERMRFFIGENYLQPRAFGIYQDGDSFVVYKNKANGSRAVRYHGPDEAYAVKELYDKLLNECHMRNIWPGGKPESVIKAEKKKKRNTIIGFVVAVVLILAITAVIVVQDAQRHANDGYYSFGDSGLYYRYGSNWYYDDYYYNWVLMSDVPYDNYGDYYVGSDYDSDWGYSDFRQSSTWSDIQREESSHTTSDDYDSWDSGDTDWSSDW